MPLLKVYEESFPIRSYQADAADYLRPTSLLEMMQEMAGAHAEMLDIGHRMLVEHGLAWVLTRVEVRMQRYPKSHETLHITTFPMPNRRWFFPRYFVFRDAAGNEVGCAGSLWVLMDIHDRKMSKPDAVLPFIPDNRDLTPPMGMPCTVEIPETEAIAGTHTPVYTELDVNGHVNNTHYLDWCINALGVDAMTDCCLAEFALNFHQEILPGQVVRTEMCRLGDRFAFSGFEGDKRHFDVGGRLIPRT